MDSHTHHIDSSRHPYRPVAHQPLTAVQEENKTPVDESSPVMYVIKSIYNEIVGYTTFETLYYYNFFTAGLHLASAVIIFIISRNLEPQFAQIQEGLTRNFTDVSAPYIAAVCILNRTQMDINSTDFRDRRGWVYVEPEQTFDRRVYFAVLIVIFFSLSAVFQGGQGCFKESYKKRVESNGVNLVRYIEYSLSASVMMVAIAAGIMIYDVYTHILVFTCTMLCMLLGLVADYIGTVERFICEEFPGDKWQKWIELLHRLKWAVHLLGWVAILSPYILVFGVAYFRLLLKSSQCSQSQNASSDGPPEFVTYILLSQFLLFASFGVVQALQFCSYPQTEDKPDRTEDGIDGLKDGHKEVRKHEETPKNEKPKKVRMYRPERSLKHPNNVVDENDPYYLQLKRIGIATEHRFITLSMVAKSVLGWFIVANIIFV